jgi:NAD(P)-dependent dehydrogenase (short-subunit alcohol dehydrogenase family)
MRVYVVTGASSGIGREVTLQLAAAGHRVIAVGRDEGRLRDLAGEGTGIVPRVLDLCDRAAVVAFARGLAEAGHIDGLINNAAVQHNSRFDSADLGPEAIAAEVETNLIAPMLLARLLLPPPGGRFVIVNVGSPLGVFPKSTAAGYSASKAGLRMVSDALRVQLADRGTRVVEVVLPLVDTPMTAGRGRGKIGAAEAARAIVGALESPRSRIHVGKARLLRLIAALSPPLAAAIVRRM